MVNDEPTRKIVKRLMAAGFTRTDSAGSHTKWIHPGGVQVIVPTGHRTISPGVVRQINKAIERSRGST